MLQKRLQGCSVLRIFGSKAGILSKRKSELLKYSQYTGQTDAAADGRGYRWQIHGKDTVKMDRGSTNNTCEGARKRGYAEQRGNPNRGDCAMDKDVKSSEQRDMDELPSCGRRRD